MDHGGMASDNNLMSTDELADYLGVPIATVHQWRYRRDVVEAWLDTRSGSPAA